MALDTKRNVSLFVTCIVDQFFPEVGESVVRVLRRHGVEVDFPRDQSCCGQPLLNSGFAKRAAGLGRRVLKSFDGDKPVVVPSGSCASMIRVYYPQLFEGDRRYQSMAENLASRTYEFGEYMVKVLGVTEAEASFAGGVTYHPSCHLLREVEASAESEGLVRAACGDRYTPLPQGETCCGFGGTFAVKMSHISESMLEDKVVNVLATGAEGLVSSDMGCLMHIGGGLSRRGANVRPMHLAQLLDEAG
jgi:L-lactate dehydrogenase complex protein LldE